MREHERTLAAALHEAVDGVESGDRLPGILARVRRPTIPAVAPGLPSGATAGTTPLATIYPRAWACWAAGTVISFAAIEVAALRSAPGHGTLTAQLRRNRRLSAACIAAFAVWAVDHVERQGGDPC